MEYFYKDAEGREQGPVSLRRVLELIDDGVITSDTPLRKTTIGAWNPAGGHRTFQEIFDPLSAPTQKNLPKLLTPAAGAYETTGAKQIAQIMQPTPSAMKAINWVLYRRRIHAGAVDIFIHMVVLAIICAGVLQWHWDSAEVWTWNGGSSFTRSKGGQVPGDIYTLWSGGVNCYARQIRNQDGTVKSEYWLDVSDPEHRAHLLFNAEQLGELALKLFAGYLVLYALIGLAIKQQTLGMGSMNIRLLDASGRRASQPRSLLFALLWLLIGILYPLTALFTSGRGLHAQLSGTQVK